MFLWQKTIAQLQRKLFSQSRELYSQLSGQLNESIQGAVIVQAFQQEETIVEEYEEKNKEWARVGRGELRLDAFFSWSLVGLLRNITLLCII